MNAAFDPRRILVLKLRHIGDVLLVTPVFQALRYAFPQSEISACVHQGTEQILAGHPLLKEVFVVPKTKFSLRDQWSLIFRLRTSKFDLLLDFTGSDRSAILSRLSGARERWGYFRAKGFIGRNRLFTRTTRRKKNAHVVEQQAEFLEQFGIPSPNPRLAYSVREVDRQAIAALVSKSGPTAHPLVHVHPVSRLMVKTWPVKFMAELLEYFCARELHPVLTASNDPGEKQWMQELRALTSAPFLDLSGRVSLPQLAALSERSVLFVGVDSAPLHIAAAVGTPVVGIFGPSSEELWGPWCEKSLVLSRDMDCRLPCQMKNTCPHIACLREMTPNMVIPKLDHFLSTLKL